MLFHRDCFKAFAVLTACLCGLPAAAQAASETYGFTNITNNNSTDADAGEAQLKVTVASVDGEPNQVSFTFWHDGTVAMSITDVYFDDGTLLGIASISYTGDVSFSQGANPGDLPGGNQADPDFVATAGFTADSDPPAQPNGVNPGETLTIVFDLQNSYTYEDVIAALAQATGTNDDGIDGLRIGIHVQGFDGGGSESFVNGGGGGPDLEEVVPEPASIFLFGLGTLGMGVLARRRRQSEESELV